MSTRSPFFTLARIRPLLNLEDESSSISYDSSTVILSGKGRLTGITRRYDFDTVIGPQGTQSDVFIPQIQTLIDSTLKGSDCSVITFGASNTGKTYTLFGAAEQTLETINYTTTSPDSGLLHRSLTYIYTSLPSSCYVSLSFVQIYCNNNKETISDLFCPFDATSPSSSLKLVWNSDRFEVEKALNINCNTLSDALFLIGVGSENRLIRDRNFIDLSGSNDYLPSSRSHCIFTININSRRTKTRIGSIVFADLAGSERVDGKSSVDESKSINSSLLVFSKVVSALSSNSVPPWRESSLTKLLWPCLDPSKLAGSIKTVVIVTLSPLFSDWSCSLQGLLLATCAGRIKVEKTNSDTSHLAGNNFSSSQLTDCPNCELLSSQNDSLKRQLSVMAQNLATNQSNLQTPTPANPKAAIQSLLQANQILSYHLSVVEKERDKFSDQISKLLKYVGDLESQNADLTAKLSRNAEVTNNLDSTNNSHSFSTNVNESPSSFHASSLNNSRPPSTRLSETQTTRPLSASSVQLSYSKSRPQSAVSVHDVNVGRACRSLNKFKTTPRGERRSLGGNFTTVATKSAILRR
ncbi:hypothetical protein RCL1_002391 [Eukaryota sp. TZLM3-RCL]